MICLNCLHQESNIENVNLKVMCSLIPQAFDT